MKIWKIKIFQIKIIRQVVDMIKRKTKKLNNFFTIKIDNKIKINSTIKIDRIILMSRTNKINS